MRKPLSKRFRRRGASIALEPANRGLRGPHPAAQPRPHPGQAGRRCSGGTESSASMAARRAASRQAPARRRGAGAVLGMVAAVLDTHDARPWPVDVRAGRAAACAKPSPFQNNAVAPRARQTRRSISVARHAPAHPAGSESAAARAQSSAKAFSRSAQGPQRGHSPEWRCSRWRRSARLASGWRRPACEDRRRRRAIP